ncbi:MAG: LysM peptidoglycan-binding domain-containing protein [Acidobacteria bacterium]|nr:LysM peptidoglycan-binding domain-containing protein [Acidobacteriota bacterium]
MASFNDLKSKYNPILQKGEEVGMTLQNIHLDGEKILIRGVVPSDFAKNQIWDAVKRIDPSVSDAIIDINVQHGLTYNVTSGDTLSKIAKRFYGDANAYKQIFDANRDQLSDPDKIKVGQQLRLP